MATSNFVPLVSETGTGGRYGSVGLSDIYFGVPSTRSSGAFSIPVIKFKFYDPFGSAIGESPTIYMQSPAQLDLQQLASYSPTSSIFGGNVAATSRESTTVEGENSIKSFGFGASKTFAEAILSGIAKSFGSVSGYIQSAGQSDIDQAEFTRRQLVNPMQQLLYKGPQFKPYSFQFNLRPRNEDESKAALNIISCFKIANSPKFQAASEYGDDSLINLASDVASEINTFINGQPLTFGYPDLVEFEISMWSGTPGDGESAETLYKSKLCAIEAVGATYGQQKMSFFNSEGAASYPTETLLSLQLKEVVFRTTEDAIIESSNPSNTLR